MMVVVAVALVAYVQTLAPTITWAHDGADGGDLITAVVTRGIPHPTGYPTYLLLGRLFLVVPWGDHARRLNLMSAVFAALAAGLVYLIVLCTFRLLDDREIRLRERVVAAASALAFAFSPIFWSQALISEVYALNAFFVAFTITLLLSWMEARRAGFLIVAALVYGLGLGNHLTLALLAPAIALFLLLRPSLVPDSTRQMIATGAAFLLGLSVYAVVPLRASHHPAVNWGDPRTLDRFLWLVSGRMYRGFAFGLPLRHLLPRLSAWAGLLVRQFGWWGLFLGLIGVWSLWEKARDLVLVSGAIIFAYSVYAIAYDTSDSHVYLIPAFIALAVWLAWGLERLLAELDRVLAPPSSRWVRALPLCLALAIPLLSFAGNFSSADLSADREAREYGLEVLQRVGPEGIVVSQTDPHTFTLWYFRYAQGMRQDVVVVDGDLLYHPWYSQNMSRVHPHVDFSGTSVDWSDSDPSCASSPLTAFIGTNLARYPIYLTDPDPRVRSCYLLSEEGSMHRVTGYREG